MSDLVIRGGNLVDRSGAHVAKPNGLIAAVCTDIDPGKREIDATSGCRHRFVAGVETVTDDELTGEPSGRLVRGPQESSRS